MKPSSGIEPQVIGLDARRRWGILAICCTSLFVVGLDTTIVNVALPTIGEGFRVGTRGLEWVVNAYTLVPGQLADLVRSGGRSIRQETSLSDRACRFSGWRRLPAHSLRPWRC